MKMMLKVTAKQGGCRDLVKPRRGIREVRR